MISSSEPSGGVTAWAVDLMERLGAPGAGLAVALENLFPPVPSEVILPLAGFTASRGEMSLVAAIAWTTIGSVSGALLLYLAGAMLGPGRVRAIGARLPLVRVADIDRTEAWFDRHGTKAVFFGRMVPVFRSLISVPAGVTRMRLPVFVTLTALGSLIWNTTFVVAGYLLGESWWRVEEYTGLLQKAVLGLVAAAVVAFVATRLRRRWARPDRRRTARHGR